MSRTEIYVKHKDKKRWKKLGEVRNATRGAWKLWSELEKKYLPTYNGVQGFDGGYNSRLVCYTNESLNEIWNLQTNPNLDIAELNVFRSTLDDAIIIKQDIPTFVEYLEIVGERYDTNHSEQAKVIKEYYQKFGDNIEAIAYNQSSVCSEKDIFGGKMDRPLDDFFDSQVTETGMRFLREILK